MKLTHKEKEMNMANSNILHWGPIATYIPLTCIGGWQIFAFALWVMQILAFLDTIMLVQVMQNCGVGAPSQRKDPMRMVLHFSGI